MSVVKFRRYLDEALTSPEPYFLTDDTEVPKQIYGSFKIDGNDYSIAMVQSSVAGVYYVEMGKVMPGSGKVFWWKFHSPTDIVPALSTLISFSDTTTKLLGPSLFKGAAVVMRKSTQQTAMDRALKLAQRIITNKFKSTLTLLPISQEGAETKYPVTTTKMIPGGTKFIFIARKGQDYKKIFAGDKQFAKYDFSKGEALDQSAATLIKPKKILKKKVSTKPSTKYTFANLDVDIPSSLDGETVEKLSNVKIKDAESSETKEMKTASDYDKQLSDIATVVSPRVAVMTLPGLKSMVSSIEMHGFDEKKVSWKDFKYVLSNLSAPEKDILSKYGLLSADSAGDKKAWLKIMKKLESGGIPSVSVKAFVKEYPNGNPSANAYSADSKNKATKKVSNVSPADFVSTIPGASNGPVTIKQTPSGGSLWDVEENVNDKVHHIFETMGYGNELPKISNFNTMVSYTGSAYSKYNQPLRNTVSKLLKGEKLYKTEIDTIIKGQSKFQKLARMFEKVKPLPEAVWVYRGTYIPPSVKEKVEPGYQFVDPAFLSTSLDPGISFGNDKMRIFLPKGSKVLPALLHSKHSGEREVLLPPSSVIKVIQTEIPQDSGKLFLQGVFMGSAFKSITEALKKQLTISEENINIFQAMQLVRIIEQMQKEEDTEEYNPEEKYGGEYDFDLADLFNKKIESGEYKVEGPKPEED